MEIGGREIVVAALLFAIAGILLLLFFSESERNATVAQALISDENALVVVQGTAANVTADRFSLCDQVCISIRKNGVPSAELVANGESAVVTGRVKEYMGRRYIEAGKVEVG